MIRGTTPTFQLKIDDQTVDLTEARNVYATFEQRGKKLTKTGEDIEVTAKQVDVYFSQAESLQFETGSIDIQLNWTYSNGARACTDIIRVTVGENLVPEVLE
ncbi:hypothetical protein IKF15_02175 [Candidatus Saccharibacteria bacterium]|nr:hypothetical protein [Candidatus Saccharibacteria bacterium]